MFAVWKNILFGIFCSDFRSQRLELHLGLYVVIFSGAPPRTRLVELIGLESAWSPEKSWNFVFAITRKTVF